MQGFLPDVPTKST